MERQIDLVIFDLDGTLMDAYDAVYDSLVYTLKQLGLKSDVDHEMVKRAVGWGDTHFVRQFSGDDLIDQAMVIYREHHKQALKENTIFLPGAEELLLELKKRGYKLAVATNRPSPYTHIALEHLGIASIFDYVLCGDEVANPKPAAEMLNKILGKFSLIADKALYVGDMTIDVITGNAAGIRTVAVVTGSSLKEELDELDPFRVVFDVYDVIKVLDDVNLTEERAKK